jgi:serine/threonine protein kinase
VIIADELKFVTNTDALEYLNGLPKRTKVPFASLFPTVNPLACDLMERMLVFNPDKRISVVDALRHPYLRKFGNDAPPPTCPTSVDFSFEKVPVSKKTLQGMFLEEIVIMKGEQRRAHQAALNAMQQQAAAAQQAAQHHAALLALTRRSPTGGSPIPFQHMTPTTPYAPYLHNQITSGAPAAGPGGVLGGASLMMMQQLPTPNMMSNNNNNMNGGGGGGGLSHSASMGSMAAPSARPPTSDGKRPSRREAMANFMSPTGNGGSGLSSSNSMGNLTDINSARMMSGIPSINTSISTPLPAHLLPPPTTPIQARMRPRSSSPATPLGSAGLGQMDLADDRPDSKTRTSTPTAPTGRRSALGMAGSAIMGRTNNNSGNNSNNLPPSQIPIPTSAFGGTRSFGLQVPKVVARRSSSPDDGGLADMDENSTPTPTALRQHHRLGLQSNFGYLGHTSGSGGMGVRGM